MLFDITEPDDSELHYVRIEETHVGKGVFAVRPYPATAIIGEIKGQLIGGNQETDSEYVFDYEDSMQLVPSAPFRYINHSCDPNCEFEIIDFPVGDDGEIRRGLFLSAITEILPGQQFSIAYNWPAAAAIECHCGSENCVGWIVCDTELDQVMDGLDDEAEDELALEQEFDEAVYFFAD